MGVVEAVVVLEVEVGWGRKSNRCTIYQLLIDSRTMPHVPRLDVLQALRPKTKTLSPRCTPLRPTPKHARTHHHHRNHHQHYHHYHHHRRRHR